MHHSQILSKPKRVRDEFRAWNFYYTIQTHLLEGEGVCTNEKKLLLTKHLQIRLPGWVIIGLGCLLRQDRHCTTVFGPGPFTRYAPFDFGPSRRLRPVHEQQCTHNDPLVP